MSLIKRAVSAIEARGANPYAEWGNTAPPPPGSVGGNVGGLHVTSESASQIAAVYGCCALLADSVASLPLRALDAPAHLTTANEVKLPPLLENPYEPISLTDWLVSFVWSLALRGNFFGQIIERDKLGYPTQIMPVNPDVVKPHVNGQTGEVEWWFAKNKISPEDVFHVRYQVMPGMLLGLNPIQVMKYPFGLAHVLDVHAATTFANSANPLGVIEVKGTPSEATIEQWIRRWLALHQGVNQSSLPAVLTEEAKFNPISISPEDQQLLESRRYSQEEICGVVFRIPPHMLGLTERSTSFGRGIEQQERTFVANTLAGYLCRGERALTECLPPSTFANFDISRRIRGTAPELAQTGSLGMLGGFFTANEVRGKYFDLPPHPDGDELFSPINTELLREALVQVEQAEKAPEQQEAPSKEVPDEH